MMRLTFNFITSLPVPLPVGEGALCLAMLMFQTSDVNKSF